MTKSPILNFLLGVAAGGMLATIIVLHIVTNQVQARNAALAASVDGATEAGQKNIVLSQKLIDTWRGRAEACEDKFRVITVIYQPQPAATIPLLHGMASLELGGGSKASLYIPAQVDIYTNRSDVRFEWIDIRTGASRGVRFAGIPSVVQ